MRFSSGSSLARVAGGAAGVLLVSLAGCALDESGLGGAPIPVDGSALDGPRGAGGGAGATTTDAPVGDGAGGAGGGDATGSAGSGGDAGGATGMDGAAGTGDAVGPGGSSGSGGAAGSNPGTGGGGDGGGGAGAGGADGGGGSGGGGSGGGGVGGGRGCHAGNCSDGCCDGDACVRARSTERCGAAGTACRPCDPCQLCSDAGRCRIDPASRWTIAAGEVRLTDTFPGSSGWDPPQGQGGGEAPDPFVEFENPAGVVSPTTAGFTTTLTDRFDPSWDGEVITPKDQTVSAATLMDPMPAWLIWIGDEDSCNGQSCLAEVACQIRRPITEDELADGRLRVQNRHGCERVELDLVCQAP